MKTRTVVATLFLITSTLITTPATAHATDVRITGVSMENRYIVEGRNGSLKHLLGHFNNSTRLFGDFALINAHSEAIHQSLKSSGTGFGLVTISPDQRKTRADVPNDTYWSDMWAMDVNAEYGIDLLAAHDLFTTKAPGEDAIVAVVDTGYTAHPDLADSYIGGYDFLNDISNSNDGDGRDANPSDPGDWYGVYASSWHGTHVHGTIAATKNNYAGVVGVAPAAKVIHGRVLGTWGGYDSEIAQAIRWSAGLSVPAIPNNNNKADIVNMSLGGFGPCSSVLQSAITAARNAGTLVVVAAGNEISNAANYSPANCANVITVAATGPEGFRSWYSNYGAIVDVAAPGGDSDYGVAGEIVSTLNSGTTSPGLPTYASYQGTSMATPHVAGIAALIRSANPLLSASQIESILRNSVNLFAPDSGFSSCSKAGNCGSGLVDAEMAVEAALSVSGVANTQVRNASAEIISGGVILTWDSPVDTLNLTGYQITLEGSGSKCTNALENTSCTFSRLKNGTAYTAVIQAKYGSAFVSGIPITFMPAGKPSLPKLKSVSSGVKTLTPTWDISQNNGSPIVSYRAEALTSSGVIAGYCETTAKLSCVITGLTSNVAYKIRITATNAMGSASSTSRSTYRPR